MQEGDEILITELEHHSNYVPWHFLRKSKNIKINFAEINEDCEITLEEIEKKITPKTKIISITHLSNVTGAILPIKEITELAHSKNIIVVVDGCQEAPHLRLDMQDLDCDFYAISCHKMYGPTGLGVLYGKKKWLEELPPYQGGGGMINEVKKDRISYGELPNKYEAGTMATAQVIAFDQSIKFLESVGIENVMKHEAELVEYGQELLQKNNSVKLIGNPKNKGGVLSFTIEGIHPHDIATILFGSAVVVDPMDVYLIPGVTILVFVIHLIFYKDFIFVSFDTESARLFKYPVRRLNTLLLITVALVVAVATRAMGALPVFALLALPPLASLYITENLKLVFLLSVLFGILSAVLGYFFSFVLSIPTGASIAVSASAFFIIALIWREIKQ